MAGPRVQAATGLNSAALPMTAGNSYTFALMWSGTSTAPTVLDSHNVTATAIGSPFTDVDGNKIQLFTAAVGTSGSNTVTASGGAGTLGLVQCILTEWTGYQAVVDVAAPGGKASSTNPSSGAMATTVAGDLIYAVASSGTISSFTAGAGYTPGLATAYQDNVYQQDEYKVAGATGSETATFTCASGWWSCVAVALKAAVTAPTSDFTTSVDQKTVTLTDTSTPGSNPITSYDTDWGDGSAHATTANASHTYTTGGSYTVTHTVSDGTTPNSATATVITKPRHTYSVARVPGGESSSVTADVPDA